MGEDVVSNFREGLGDYSQRGSKNSSRAKSRHAANGRERQIKMDREAEKRFKVHTNDKLGSGREEEEEKGGVKAAYSPQMANDKQAAGFVCYHIIFCFLLVIEISIKRFLCNFRCENPLGEKDQTM